MTLVIPDKDIIEITNMKDGKITEPMKMALKENPTTARIFIEYIKCVGPKGDIYSAYPLNFEIK
jgi:hypothetical protein